MVVTAVAVAVILSGSAGYLLGSARPSGLAGSGTSAQTTCTIAGETIGVALRVVAIDYSTHSVVPVVGAGINGSGVLYCNGERQVTVFPEATTNASGWVEVFHGGGGIYYLNISYPGSNLIYSVSVPVMPVTATYVVFNASTGNVTTHFCSYNFHCT